MWEQRRFLAFIGVKDLTTFTKREQLRATFLGNKQRQADGTFKVVAESAELIKPDPFPKGYQ